ncbi:helix-turn-helix domain-containing protein [Nocardia brevicatena]|uniref:helix-turn-helix domain-containing protein n=1 Tax=Nocardia brevicatena TaxID=37327 RepID=UPI000A03FA9A|nr:helix-turn-helix domain-containing protein [Nocardia brevicatena]
MRRDTSSVPPTSLPGRATGESHEGSGRSAAADNVWLSSEEVAQRLKLPVKTLASWAAAGRGPRYARMGRYRRYRLEDLLAWEQEQLDRSSGATDR